MGYYTPPNVGFPSLLVDTLASVLDYGRTAALYNQLIAKGMLAYMWCMTQTASATSCSFRVVLEL